MTSSSFISLFTYLFKLDDRFLLITIRLLLFFVMQIKNSFPLVKYGNLKFSIMLNRLLLLVNVY